MPQSQIDCRGLVCPMPILQTRLALNRLHPGDLLEILADDPTFAKEIHSFCYLAQLVLLNHQSYDTHTSYLVQVQ